jgi:hypothetical protein
MPLQDTSTPYYLQRYRLFVDSDEKIPSESPTEFEYTVRIRGSIRNVVSIELVDWSLQNIYAPTFIGKYNSLLPGNYYSAGEVTAALGTNDRHTYASMSKFDIRIQDETFTNEHLLTVDMDEFLFPQSLAGVQYNSRQAVVDAVTEAIAFHFEKDGVTDPNINYTNTSFFVGLDTPGHLQIYFYRTVGNAAMPCYFLFETGPSVSDAAPKPLGFLPGVDTTLPPLAPSGVVGDQYILTSPNLVNPIPVRYVDVIVKEADIEPLARVYFQSRFDADPYYNQPFDKGLSVRLLTEPIDYLTKLTVKLQLPDGQEPSFYGAASHQLTFELLSFVPVQECSNWMIQKFGF